MSKLNSLKYKCLCQLNSTYIWTACLCLTELFEIELFEIELFFDIKTVFTLNWIVTYNCNCFLTLILYLHWTELFNMELFWHVTVCKQSLYFYKAELAEEELLD